MESEISTKEFNPPKLNIWKEETLAQKSLENDEDLIILPGN